MAENEEGGTDRDINGYFVCVPTRGHHFSGDFVTGVFMPFHKQASRENIY